MPNQRKNRVKLNKKYKRIGRIPDSALKEINNYIELRSKVQTIRACIGNTIKHNHRHLDELEEQLNRLGITKEGYAEFVAKHFNQITFGQQAKVFGIGCDVGRLKPYCGHTSSFRQKRGVLACHHRTRHQTLRFRKNTAHLGKMKKGGVSPPFFIS